MSDFLPFLKSLISVPGLSGHEAPVATLIEGKWRPLADELHRSRLGSIHALKKGRGGSPRSSIMIASHMDAVGLMVSKIMDGFLYITQIGDIDPRVLPGAPVTVHASKRGEELHGVIVLPPAGSLPKGKGDDAVELKHLFVDVGFPAKNVSARVNIGDLVSFDTKPVELSGGCLSGHSLDNRASVTALTICLEELQARPHNWDVIAAAPVQEEITFAGAYTSAYQLHPSIAVAVDVTFGKSPGTDDHSTFALGKGVTLGVGASMHPFLHKRFKGVAERMGIPVVDEAMPAVSLTDADAMQLTAAGIPAMVLGIPLRNMHTPVEVVALNDIQHAGRLLAAFVISLEADFVNKIVWD